MHISVVNNNVKHPQNSFYLGSCTLPSTSCLWLPREEGRCWECWWTPTTPAAPSWSCPLSTKTLLTLRPLHDLRRHQKPCPWPSSPWKPGTGCGLWGSQRRTSWCWSHRVFGRTDYSLLHRRPQTPSRLLSCFLSSFFYYQFTSWGDAAIIKFKDNLERKYQWWKYKCDKTTLLSTIVTCAT